MLNDGDLAFFRFTRSKIMGNFPDDAHEDWIFLELENEFEVEQGYPIIVNTDVNDWVGLSGKARNVTYLTYVFPDGKLDDVKSNQLMTASANCLTDRLTINALEYFPDDARELNWKEFETARYGISNCPSNLTGSGSPFFDRDGNIGAINSWQRSGDTPRHFNENIVNAHLLSEAFYQTYVLMISGDYK